MKRFARSLSVLFLFLLLGLFWSNLQRVPVATAYYLDETDGDCNDAVGSAAMPFCTLAPALAALTTAGDSLTVVAGSYDTNGTIAASGSMGSEIIIQNPTGHCFVGETCPIIRNLTASGKSHFIIKGIEFTNDGLSAAASSPSVSISGGTNITIQYNYFRETDFTCVRIGGDATFVSVLNNRVTYCNLSQELYGTTAGDFTFDATHKVLTVNINGTDYATTFAEATLTAAQVCAAVDLVLPDNVGDCTFGTNDKVMVWVTGAYGSTIALTASANDAASLLGISAGNVVAFGAGIGIGAAACATGHCDDILISDNDISHVGDYANFPEGTRIVFRNNTCGPVDEFSWFHVDCAQLNGPGATYILVEGIRSIYNNNSDNHLYIVQDAGGPTIIRLNWSCHSPAPVIYDDATGLRYFRNTNYQNSLYSYAGNSSLVGPFTGTSSDNYAWNNIFEDAVPAIPTQYNAAIDGARADLWDGGSYNAWPDGTNSTATFVNPGGCDLRQQPGSVGIDLGSYDTTVDGADAGSGTVLTVVDAKPYQPGWAGVNADRICVGATIPTATCDIEIVSIDYAMNEITVSAGFTRTPGSDKVWLFRNSKGERVIYGSAPDVGAFEYGSFTGCCIGSFFWHWWAPLVRVGIF